MVLKKTVRLSADRNCYCSAFMDGCNTISNRAFIPRSFVQSAPIKEQHTLLEVLDKVRDQDD